MASMISRCYLPEFEKIGVRLQVVIAKPQPVQNTPQQAFKKSVYTGKLQTPKQADML